MDAIFHWCSETPSVMVQHDLAFAHPAPCCPSVGANHVHQQCPGSPESELLSQRVTPRVSNIGKVVPLHCVPRLKTYRWKCSLRFVRGEINNKSSSHSLRFIGITRWGSQKSPRWVVDHMSGSGKHATAGSRASVINSAPAVARTSGKPNGWFLKMQKHISFHLQLDAANQS